ncbi:MAG: hypothetical protein ACTHK2_14635 [Dokdonella sp.]|uniref:hypothetical protein n=1 Tax=Dokdonella sp. TaxID=2291710 RepID=UPI003F7D5CA7
MLRCYRYIELNPVRAAMVGSPAEHPWSSYRANAGGGDDPLIHPHSVYLGLGRNATERCAAYRALFAEAISDEQLAEIRAYAQPQRALGNDRFQRLIEAELGRCARVRPAHRPPRKPEPIAG